MRLVSLLLLCIVLLAQAPLGIGPGTTALGPGVLDSLDWALVPASGCTAGARGMCTGNTSVPQGDTIYFTGWLANSSLLPITTGLPLVGTMNDFTSVTCTHGNLMLMQLAEFSWTAKGSSRMYEINCMSSYGTAQGAQNSPAGWFSHCTSGDAGNTFQCGWKSRQPFARGALYLMVERQISSGSASVKDATIISSTDGGVTWKNPYTFYNAGAADANGDAPKCGAIDNAAGHACTDAGYLDATHSSMMWKALPTSLAQWEPISYGQDGNYPTGITDGCDPAVVVCFWGGPAEGTLMRLPNASIQDVSTAQYYTCPAITLSYRCNGALASSWTSDITARTSVFNPLRSTSFNITYLSAAKTYLAQMYYVGTDVNHTPQAEFVTAPAVYGPWTEVAVNPLLFPGFIAASLSPDLGYSVVSSNPLHLHLPVITDTYYHLGSSVYSAASAPVFSLVDITLGQPSTKVEQPRSNLLPGGLATNSGLIFSDSHVPGSLPRSGLLWAFDFYDHGGVVDANYKPVGFKDVVNGSAIMAPCHMTGTTPNCNWTQTPVVPTLTTFGVTVPGSSQAASSPSIRSMMRDQPQTIASAASHTTTGGLTPINAPDAFTGNGTFTVIAVYRPDAGGQAYPIPVWVVGDFAGTNTSLALSSGTVTTNAPMYLSWGNNSVSWSFASAFYPTTSNWYFTATTVSANGDTPICHVWVGIGGALTDVIAGVTRTQSGAATKTPNISAAPFSLAWNAGNTTANHSYAGLYPYNRVLSLAEIGLAYQSLKNSVIKRGITLQ